MIRVTIGICRLTVFLLLVVKLLVIGSIAAISSYGLEVEYSSSALYSGNMTSLYVDGSYAYSGASNSFQILSVSDPENPLLIEGHPLRGHVHDVAIAGEYAFLSERIYSYPYQDRNFIRCFDISLAPLILQCDSLDIGDIVYSIDVSGDYAFVSGFYDGLSVIDISNPWNINVIVEYDSPGYEKFVTVSGDYAYLATTASDLVIVDISDLQNLYTVSSFDSTRGSNSIFIRGEYAYVAQGVVTLALGSLTIINISDQGNPTYYGEYVSWGVFYKIDMEGNYAYVLSLREFGTDFLIIDISNPASPTLAGSQYLPIGYFDLKVDYPYCYLTGAEPEFLTFNVSNPQNPQLVGQYNAPGYINVVAKNDSVAFAGARDGLWTVDIFHINNPAVLGHDETLGNVEDIDLWGNYAFTCEYTSGLTITDISDPSSPLYVGSYPAPYINSVFVSDYFAFSTDRDYGFIIIDITYPSNPTLASSLALPGHTVDVYIQGNYAYIANRENGLYIVDITDCSDPILVDSCDTPGNAVGVYVDGDFAYVADGYYGLQIINVQNPANPFLILNVDTEDYAQDVVVSGDCAIVAADSAGIQVVDISDLGTPQIVANYNTPGRALDCKIDGDYIYVADQYSLMILHFDRQTGTLEQAIPAPADFELKQNYPNPFNSSTTIEFDVPRNENVTISIYDILGRKVLEPVSGVVPAGRHSIAVDLSELSSGLFFYVLKTDEISIQRKMLYLK